MTLNTPPTITVLPLGAPTTREWGGTSACMADPDGFRWDFVHNPSSAIVQDGTITDV